MTDDDDGDRPGCIAGMALAAVLVVVGVWVWGIVSLARACIQWGMGVTP